MSEALEVVDTTADSQLTLEERFASQAPVDDSDTDGIPDEAVDLDAEDDGALATDNTDDEDSDIDDDDTPEDEDSDEGGFEQRYKDTQAALTEKAQELSDLKTEYADQVGEITQAKFDLQDKFSEVEQVAEYWNNMAMGQLQRLQQVNPQSLNQEQYTQWQQQMGMANNQARQTQQQIEALKEQSKKAKDDAMSREVTVSRAQLTKSIDNFDEVYPDIGKFAVDNGVNPRVFKEITDPGLIKIIHGAMEANSAPDAIEEVTRKTQATKRPARSTDGRFKPKPKSLADKLYGEK